MKNLMFLFFAIMIFPLTGFSQQTDAEAMLEDSETRKELFSTIMEDHELMTEFMEQMKSSKHAQMMMQGNTEMMHHMMGEGGMMNMMQNNPEMMRQMMSNMMKNGHMMGQMMQMMKNNGMMSESCMKTSMQMMKDKGMSMDKEKGKEDNGGSHDSHH